MEEPRHIGDGSLPAGQAPYAIHEAHLRRLRRQEMVAQVQCFLQERTGCPALHRQFRHRLGYDLNLAEPRSFNALVQWRKLRDRNPRFPAVTDKYAVRGLLRDLLGARAEDILVPLHAVHDAPADIPFDRLPGDLALKATHGCGWNLFLTTGQAWDRQAVIRQCEAWLVQRYGWRGHEWAYRKVKPRIVVEEMFLGPAGEMPDDLKFFMFGEKCAFALLAHGRFGAPDFVNLTEEGCVADFGWRRFPPHRSWPRPHRFDDMLDIAREIGRSFDFIRVDFLFNARGFALNELTLYPANGMDPFEPAAVDFSIGDMWLKARGAMK